MNDKRRIVMELMAQEIIHLNIRFSKEDTQAQQAIEAECISDISDSIRDCCIVADLIIEATSVPPSLKEVTGGITPGDAVWVAKTSCGALEAFSVIGVYSTEGAALKAAKDYSQTSTQVVVGYILGE